MRSRVRDEDWERLGKAWCAARVGSPPRIREQERARLSRAWQSPARTPSFSPLVPWRNPGDRHEPNPYEEHTIATAQHASSVLARHPHQYEPVPRTAPQPRRASPLRARAGEGRIELLTPDGVMAWLDTLFQHDDEERRRLRHEAIRQAGVDGAFLRQIAKDEKLCMFELLLTRLQARRLAAAVLARDGSGAIPQTPSLQTPSASQIEAVRDRLRRLEDVLDLSIANPRESHASLDTPAPSNLLEPEAASTECGAVGEDPAEGDAAHEPVPGDCERNQNAWSIDSNKDNWNMFRTEQCTDDGRGAPHAQRAANLSPVSTNSEESVEGELDLLWRGVGSVGGEADLLHCGSSAPAHAPSLQHATHIQHLDRRLEFAATRTQRALMNALHAASERDVLRHELDELSSEFVGSILLRRAAADPSAPRHSFRSSGAGGADVRDRGGKLGEQGQHAVHGKEGTRAKTQEPFARDDESCTVWVVGGWNGFNLLATSEYLDTRNSQWVRGPSLPNPRRGACSVALGARLLIFGGWDGSQHLRDAHWMDTSCVDYTILTHPRAWFPLPALPHATCQAAAAAVCQSRRRDGGGGGGAGKGGKTWDVFVLGGHAAVPSPRVHVLTVVQPGEETMLEEGVAQRGEEPAQSVRGREAGKVASGNRDRSRDRSRGRSRGKSRDKCGSEEARGGWEVGKWREVASMRTARTHHCCAAIDGLILAIGGTDGEKVLRTVECYDTARPEAGWVPVRPLAHPREGASAVVLGDSVYVIGGHDGNAHLCSVEVWSSKLHRESAGHWRPVSSLVQQRSALAAVSVGKALVALGGYCGRGGARMTSCEMWHPKDSDPRKSQWSFINGMSCPRSDHTAAAAPCPVRRAPHVWVQPAAESLSASNGAREKLLVL